MNHRCFAAQVVSPKNGGEKPFHLSQHLNLNAMFNVLGAREVWFK